MPELLDLEDVEVCYGVKCKFGKHEPGDDDFDTCICNDPANNCNIGYDYCYEVTVFTYEDCSGQTYYETENNETQTGGGSNGSNTSNPPPNTTIGVPFSIYELLVEECLNEGYDPNSLNNTVVPIDLSTYNLTPPEVEEIFAFLNIENSCSEDAKEFAEFAVESFDQDGEVSFEDRIIKDSSFVNKEKLKCIYDKLIGSENFFKTMSSSFSENDSEVLFFQCVDNLPNGEYGYTLGHEFNNNEIGFDFYSINISNEIESRSNLLKILTLSHEMIHAYMLNSLDNWGVIYYTSDGIPQYNNIAVNCDEYPANVDFSNLSQKEKWISLICAYNENNPGDEDWTHDLFNTANFIVDNYRVELENLLFSQNDWDNEPPFLKALLQTEFGSDWKQKSAEYMSWRGLQLTDDFESWAEENNISSSTDNAGNVTYPNFEAIINAMTLSGNANCNDE